jgi:uncharacterized membrane protein
VQVEFLVLRLVHILGGIVWVGSGIYSYVFLLPAIGQAGAAGGQVMMNLQKRKLFTILPIVAVVTILSGVRLMQIVSQGFSASYFATPMGRAYAISGLLAILGFAIGIAISRPWAMKLQKLQGSAVSDKQSKEMINAEIKALQSRVAMSGLLATVLVVLSAAGMAISRYM